MSVQKHLSLPDRVNLGSYYTPPRLREKAFALVQKHVPDVAAYTLLDSSCGYGSFLQKGFCRTIGADIDPQALAEASSTGAELFTLNALSGLSRRHYSIAETEKLLIMGNPPYNDSTSQARKNIKNPASAHPLLKKRDVGFSFLLSYDMLRADYVCVLHPLSYLIKKTNLAQMGAFAQNYRLIAGLIVSSGEFIQTSRASPFPIIIALYQRGMGMDYPYICNFPFEADGAPVFSLNRWERLSAYAPKYPNKNSFAGQPSAYFWTMRDINALGRNRTFLPHPAAQSIHVPQKLLPYYCYADAFKRRLSHVPYYLGNCDVPISHGAFLEIEHCFLAEAKAQHPHLPIPARPCFGDKIEEYFKHLLGEHYLEAPPQ